MVTTTSPAEVGDTPLDPPVVRGADLHRLERGRQAAHGEGCRDARTGAGGTRRARAVPRLPRLRPGHARRLAVPGPRRPLAQLRGRRPCGPGQARTAVPRRGRRRRPSWPRAPSSPGCRWPTRRRPVTAPRSGSITPRSASDRAVPSAPRSRGGPVTARLHRDTWHRQLREAGPAHRHGQRSGRNSVSGANARSSDDVDKRRLCHADCVHAGEHDRHRWTLIDRSAHCVRTARGPAHLPHAQYAGWSGVPSSSLPCTCSTPTACSPVLQLLARRDRATMYDAVPLHPRGHRAHQPRGCRNVTSEVLATGVHRAESGPPGPRGP